MRSVPFYFFFTMASIHHFIVYATFAKFEDRQTTFFSTDPVHGVFGFFDPSQALVAFIPYGIFASYFGNVGYVVS